MIVELANTAAMEEFGARIATKIKPGDVVSLEGNLGAGKTTLARAVLEALGHKGEVPSPTFTILEQYGDLVPPVIHADFYRLDSPDEVIELGLDEYRDGAVLLAEGPEKAGGFDHEASCLSIILEIVGRGRRAHVQGGEDWLDRMP